MKLVCYEGNSIIGMLWRVQVISLFQRLKCNCYVTEGVLLLLDY